MDDVSAERLGFMRERLPDPKAYRIPVEWGRDLLAMIDARDREITELREVVQSLQQEGSGRLRYD